MGKEIQKEINSREIGACQRKPILDTTLTPSALKSGCHWEVLSWEVRVSKLVQAQQFLAAAALTKRTRSTRRRWWLASPLNSYFGWPGFLFELLLKILLIIDAVEEIRKHSTYETIIYFSHCIYFSSTSCSTNEM